MAIANISKDMLPEKEEKRDDLKNIIPTGWDDNAEYKKIVPGNKLYNKSHLIAFSLIGRCEENIIKNIITGTHTFNTSGMTRYENESNHILYRVTPVFEGDNLIAKGVLM